MSLCTPQKFAVVCGSNYSGSWRVYQSENDAKRFEKLLRETFGYSEIRTLYGAAYTRANVLSALQWLSAQLTHQNCSAVVYVAGHGTQTRDASGDECDGQDENWQTNDRQLVSDDEITAALKAAPCCQAQIALITDACCSGSMLDLGSETRQRQWVSVGAALDYQCALQSGDGSVCTAQLLRILECQPLITCGELRQKLEAAMKNSFVGELQAVSVQWSNDTMEKATFIK